ncbi:MAG: hypothetical protein AB7U83_22340 [Vicinamibacterales bacterium]
MSIGQPPSLTQTNGLLESTGPGSTIRDAGTTRAVGVAGRCAWTVTIKAAAHAIHVVAESNRLILKATLELARGRRTEDIESQARAG